MLITSGNVVFGSSDNRNHINHEIMLSYSHNHKYSDFNEVAYFNYGSTNKNVIPIVSIDLNQEMNFAELEEIKQYPIGWDGGDAEKIGEELVELTKNLIMGMNVQPEIAATPSGSILLYFESCNKSQLSFNVFADHMVFCLIPNGRYEKSQTGTIRETDLFKNTIIKWVDMFERKCICC